VSGRIAVAVESGAKRVFATAVDWPGLSRSGKTEELALAALAIAAERYAAVAREAGEPFPSRSSALEDVDIVERNPGGSGTDFGVPSRVTDHDRRPVSRSGADRLCRLVAAAWTVFDRVGASAPAELRKGPRGGGRDRDKMVDHVLESDHVYAHEVGLRVVAPSRADRGSIEALRSAVLALLAEPSDGAPLGGRRWPPRYAANRIAWHALDHAWEMEDRTDPVTGAT
jgi:predicted RNase H-like HicB family nuclease